MTVNREQRLAHIEARLDYVERLMAELVPGEPRVILDANFAAALADVVRETHVARREIIGVERTNRILRARFALLWVMRRAHPDYSSIRLGELIGRRDHSTILHSVSRAELRREQEPDFRALTDKLVARALQRKDT